MPRRISRAEVAQHNYEKSCWVIIGENVYDLTTYSTEHPGGAELILKWAGKDGTKAYDNACHSDDAIELSEEFKIGLLREDSLPPERNGVPSPNEDYYSTTEDSADVAQGTATTSIQRFPKAEVDKHHSKQSCWVIINGAVFDLTNFLEEHPGGLYSILEWAGKDGSKAFSEVGHSNDAIVLQKQYQIGTIAEDTRNSAAEVEEETSMEQTEEICTCCPKCCFI